MTLLPYSVIVRITGDARDWGVRVSMQVLRERLDVLVASGRLWQTQRGYRVPARRVTRATDRRTR